MRIRSIGHSYRRKWIRSSIGESRFRFHCRSCRIIGPFFRTCSRTDMRPVWIYANDLPKPPEGYHFTVEQKIEIERFFRQKRYLSSPNLRLDLYHANYIVVCKCCFPSDKQCHSTVNILVPRHASDNLRHMVESLLITHAQTSLNTDGRLDNGLASGPIHRARLTERLVWCEDLVVRQSSSSL